MLVLGEERKILIETQIIDILKRLSRLEVKVDRIEEKIEDIMRPEISPARKPVRKRRKRRRVKPITPSFTEEQKKTVEEKLYEFDGKTSQHVANILNVSRKVANAILVKLREEGKIELERTGGYYRIRVKKGS